MGITITYARSVTMSAGSVSDQILLEPRQEVADELGREVTGDFVGDIEVAERLGQLLVLRTLVSHSHEALPHRGDWLTHTARKELERAPREGRK